MSAGAKRMGRPPAYDPDRAIEQARSVFWQRGFAATSLDELSAATSMARPSLYGAFGNKRALYRKALERYRDESAAALQDALRPDRPLRDGLHDAYRRALDVYFSGEGAARGCFLIDTGTVEATGDPEIRALLCESLRAFEDIMRRRVQLAAERGELDPATEPATLSFLLSAVLHSVAVRARAGEDRETLEAFARSSVDLLCRAGAQTEPQKADGGR